MQRVDREIMKSVHTNIICLFFGQTASQIRPSSTEICQKHTAVAFVQQRLRFEKSLPLKKTGTFSRYFLTDAQGIRKEKKQRMVIFPSLIRIIDKHLYPTYTPHHRKSHQHSSYSAAACPPTAFVSSSHHDHLQVERRTQDTRQSFLS